MTVSNNPCIAATAIYTINVEGMPTAEAGGSQTICEDGNATVIGASASYGTILWTHNGSGILTSAGTLTPNYAASHNDAGKTITLTMTVSDGLCASAEAYYTVDVTALPTATAGGSQTICVNQTATVSGASYSNGTILWTSNGAGTLNGENTISPTYTPAASDAGKAVVLTLSVSSVACTPATDIYTINVDGLQPIQPGAVSPSVLDKLLPSQEQLHQTELFYGRKMAPDHLLQAKLHLHLLIRRQREM